MPADQYLQLPKTARLGKRKSEDDMKAMVDGRNEEKKAKKAEEDKRKENYVRTPLKQRKRLLEGNYYCCFCDCKQRFQVRSEVKSQCHRCGHVTNCSRSVPSTHAIILDVIQKKQICTIFLHQNRVERGFELDFGQLPFATLRKFLEGEVDRE